MSSMFVRRPPVAPVAESPRLRSESRPGIPAIRPIDWRADQRASRACCCPAKPAVIAVMPATAGRPGLVDLLLCWHHYRQSREALAAAGATVLDMTGARIGTQAWLESRPAC